MSRDHSLGNKINIPQYLKNKQGNIAERIIGGGGL
jgi:hypothetical protein